MAAPGPLPIRFAEVLNLTKLGVKPSDIKFKNVTMESDKYVSVLEEGEGTVAIIDTVTKKLQKFPAKIDSAIMNPSSKVVGFRSGSNLQIYNLEMQTRMKVAAMNENVSYWTWLNQKSIAVVTERAVYHWSMDGDASPTQVFERAPSATPVQVLNYKSSNDGKWLILGGITSKNGAIAGSLQLYSVERKVSQPTLDALAGTFAHVKLDNRTAVSTLFCFVLNTPTGPKLSVIEVSTETDQSFRKLMDVQYESPQDFAVSMLCDDKHGTLFMLTKAGYLGLYEIQSGKSLFRKRISQATMFMSVPHMESGGIVALDQTGRLILIALDEANVVPYISQVLKDVELGVRMAARYNLGGAEGMFKQQFDRLIAGGQVAQAARIAVEAPQGVLRTPDTIACFKRLPMVQGQPAPVLQYFSLLLKQGTLNAVESIELARPVLSSGAPQGKKHLRDWITEGKLEFSEELGDLLRQHDLKLACSVYLRAQCPEKAIGCFLQLGEFDKIVAYARSVSFTPDYAMLLQQLHRINRDQALEFAQKLISSESDGALIDVTTVVDMFMAGNDAKSTTSFLLDVLQQRGDREEDAELQTKLLEINLMHSPQVADAILESDQYSLSHFDKGRIAQMCERAHLYQRALDFYTDMDDIRRVLLMGLNTGLVKPEFVIAYFGRHTPEDCLDILRDLMKYNATQHIRLVVEIAKTFSKELTPASLIALFDEFDSDQGLYYFLGSFVNFSEDEDVVFKYVQAATRLGQIKEVERICRDNEHYDAVQLKDYLIEQELSDPRPLIHVCDRHNLVNELTRVLYTKNMFAFIEAYVSKMSPAQAPVVIGSLLDLSCDENKIRDLLKAVNPQQCPIGALCDEVEQRNRLRMLLSWLEARRSEGNKDVDLHNALGKIYVETNSNPTHFIANNQFYDSKVVGKYCESRDPHLSFLAYKRACGSCDVELLQISNKHGFYKDQARYLVERQSEELWTLALNEDNEHRRALIDQVVATALPESRVPEEVSATVKAFMAADLPNELIELLERIVLHGPSDSEFHINRNLQNLLILTAIKADPPRVADYLNRLNNYDGPDIARIAISDQYKLYEEAFFIYKKFKLGEEAIQVLLDQVDSIDRGIEFAEYWDKVEVWSILGRALLDNMRTKEAIESFLKANDPSSFEDVITAANRDTLWDELISFLKMARTTLREAALDNELLYALARIDKLAQLEEFLVSPNIAKIEPVGDRIFEEGLYEAARILYSHVNNFAKLALCYVHLHQFQQAVDAARKANSIQTWKAVCYACVDAHEFRLAQACGVHIIVFMDHLSDLIHHYEVGGHFDAIIALLEQGINLDRAHQGIFTQLGVLYAQYKEDKLMEHIKLFWSRLNIPSLLSASMKNLHYAEAVFLYSHYDQYDNAVDVLIEHSPMCWDHDLFKTTVVQSANTEVFYRAIRFYLQEHPLLLNDLLIELSSKLDHSRVVNMIKAESHLPLIQKYMLFVQRDNLAAVNEALNGLYVKAEQHRALRESIDLYDQHDQIALAQSIEKHELLQMRRISAYLFKMNKRYKMSIDISKQDDVYEDVLSTAALSKDSELCESLLRFFIEKSQLACFTAMLYACYDQIRADVVLELAWRHDIMQNVMPFIIQTFRSYDTKLSNIEQQFENANQVKRDAADAEKKKQEDETSKAAQFVGAPMLGGPSMNAPLCLPAPPVGMTTAGMHMGGNMQQMPMGMPPPGMVGGVHMAGMPPPGQYGF